MENQDLRPEIRVKAKVSQGLNLLSIVNDPLPSIVSLAIENLSEKGIKDLKVQLSFTPAFGQEHEIFFQYLGPKSTSLVSPNELKKLSFDRKFFSELEEEEQGQIHIRVLSGESQEPIAEEDLSISLSPYDVFLGKMEGKESQLASYVMPALSGVKGLAIKIGDRLRSDSKGFAVGYQEDVKGVLDQVEAAYQTLRSLSFSYKEEKLSEIEKIQIPDITLARKSGTGLDLAILFASVLENIGLHAILALKDEKSYVGCFLEEDVFLSNSVEDSPSHVQSLVEQKNLVLVDVSKLSNPIAEFKEATSSIEESFLQGFDSFCAIDLSICRDSGIFPLPLTYDAKEEKVLLSDNRMVLKTYDHYDALSSKDEKRSGFDVWERELLDLSMNNPLLNYRIKKSISFLCGDTNSFAQSYKSDDKFTISPKPISMTGNVDPLQYASDDRYSALVENAIKNKKLISLEGETELKERLKRIYRKYRDNLNETGSNTLYLTIGLLRYYELQNQDNLGAYRLSPLILIPIDIVRDVKSKGSYYIRLRDEEWLLNTTLIEFLKKERNLDLSKVEEILPGNDGHLDVGKILSLTEKAISGIKGWYCYPNYLGLGSFDFTHYCMWNDLRQRKEQMERNPIVKSLATGRKEWSESLSSHPITESDCCIPLVADSSQIEAVMKCADGKSFILFGPPGTGKSQTIVNMIANSLYHGKKVLFVSEKQAALDVVYNRLKRIGLDPFCLQLHSAKASKAMVLKQFSNAFKNAQLGSPSDFERCKESVIARRNKLEYDIEVFHKASPCFLSINDALIGYESVKDERHLGLFEDSFLKGLTSDKFKAINDLSERIAYLENYGHFGTYYQNDLMPLKGHAYGLEKRELLSRLLDEWIKKAQMLAGRINKIKETFRPTFSLSRENVSFLVTFLKNYLVAQAPTPLASAIVDFSLVEEEENITRFLDLLEEYQKTRKEKIMPFLKEEVLKDKTMQDGYSEAKSIDLSGKFLHRSKSLSKAKKVLSPYLKTKVKKNQAGELLEHVIHLQNLVDQMDDLLPSVRNVYRDQFVDIDETDAEKMRKQYDYSLSLYRSVDHLEDLAKKKRLLSAFLSFTHSLSSLTINSVNVFLSLYQEFENSLAEQKEKFDFDLDVLPDRSDYFNALPGSLGKIKEKLPFAGEWANMNSALDELKAMDLGEACKALVEGKVRAQNLKDAIDCSIYLGIALLSIRENNLESFSGLSEEATIRKYNEECALFRELSIAKLRSQLSEDIPSEQTNASPTSELGFLKKAIASNGHGKSIRKILDGANNLVRTLCPCFLMSPMSAATYLSPEMSNFDVVIFDEASQIPTAEAVGPISRGKSLVVCGDSNQLPPTSFFKRDTSLENSDFLNSSLPSILEECKAIMLPEQELRWHYRSRSESLIAFSNHEFYYDSLYTFPSIDDQLSMVKYIHVDSSYDRSHSRTNVQEAEAIVKEVLRRKKDPKLKEDSIGIVCFSQAQKDLVEDKLDDAMTEEMKQEDEQSVEPIFVKNLENVQGDERDVIIFSIGYGMDRNRRMTMNFGPINGINGFRRLNVAISRARKEMLIYTNIDPDLYHDEDIDNPGAQYLFRFLRYAKHGRSALSNSTRTVEKREEVLAESMAAELRKKGYVVHTSVGDSAFHLNLALVDKEHPEDYLLGVMIEGEQGTGYHLIDKLQIQPSVLKSLGWKTIRVYAIDWINSPTSVITEIEIAYKKALEDKRGKNYQSIYKKEETPERKAPVLESNVKRVSKGKDYIIPNYNHVPAEAISEEGILHQIQIVLKNEAPISDRLLQKRITKIFGLPRLANRNKDLYDQCVKEWSERHLTTKNKDNTVFFWQDDQDPKKLRQYRKRGGMSDRNLDDIPKEEIALAIYDILKDQFAIDRDGLARQLLSYFGVSRDTGKYREIIEESIDWAKENRTDFLTVGEKGTFLLKD